MKKIIALLFFMPTTYAMQEVWTSKDEAITLMVMRDKLYYPESATLNNVAIQIKSHSEFRDGSETELLITDRGAFILQDPRFNYDKVSLNGTPLFKKNR